MSEDKGANNNQRLLAAARTDNEELLLEVFEAGDFDINHQDGVGNTAPSFRNISAVLTYCSVQNGSTDVLEHILSHEACDVDPINRINRATPLHLACQLEDDGMRSYMVESLLDAGADTKIRDKNGELAVSFVPPTDEETRKLFRKTQAHIMTVSQDDIASDDDGEAASGSGSGSDED
ncbi:hypothetical protein DFJ43DRAFT_1149745 [Lentinula guzmanii]|uniref:Ankyrin n=1 Tax=Lentinula guzmanii TaxID=2804957 RepID=A0AA38MXI6_9AGAR|nr:hypothetical protein DFJ43DRAFT_1149745 [Lentinula guzmanii]